MRAALFACAALTACRFSLSGVGTGSSDMATSDLGPGPDLPPCACATGCGSDGHCLALAPSGPVTAGDYGMAGLAVYNVTGNITINTDTGAITGPGPLMRAAGSGVINGVGFHVVKQTGGPGVGVFSVAALMVAGAAKINVTGANAFALASAGPVTIDGVVDASCSGMMPGPGGFAGGMGAMDGTGPAAGAGKAGTGGGGGNPASGGGGAGYGDAGGTGGLIQGAAPNAGVPFGDLTSPTFVLAGGPGGGGGAGTTMGGKGGGGGGAVQIVANGALTVTGTINVGGCGGLKAGIADGGGGGGAGGAIVLEAVHVTLSSTAVLAANGGGGGSGDDGGHDGSPANASVVPAPGGVAGKTTGGNGGAGGASNGMPGQHFTSGRNGGIPDPTQDFGGGGGGGVGRIAVRALNPTTGGISDSSTAVTPDANDT
ncbi:MAG TPA: hypothetical protein VF997_02830, partial [Polyangia bacterium]